MIDGIDGHNMSTIGRLIILAAIAVVSAGEEAYVKFESVSYRYRARVPAGWYHCFGFPKDLLVIDSFPKADAAHGIHVPKGGAELWVAPLEAIDRAETPTDLESWVALDTRADSTAVKRTAEFVNKNGTLHGFEVLSECCGTAKVLKTVAWYFTVAGRPFSARLTYSWGEPGQRYRDILAEVVRTLDAERPAEQHDRQRAAHQL